MTRRVDQIEVVDLAIFRFVMERCSLSLDGYPTLFFNVHRVQHLRRHIARLKSAATLDQTIGQC